MPGLILAGATPDNTPGGYYYTFLFPMVLFIVVAVVLYMLFSKPHRRVPGEPISVATGPHLQASGAELADSGSGETPGDTDPADVDAAVSSEGQDAAPSEGSAQADTGAN